ncbi:MAG: TRAP transporter substrate-binding protein [Rhodospirillaceae bacterium]|jgi:TRAP-type mannitol/chloroaromatic compound transport system substrate-binding protein|nr:TRAP transporter substrate-binding protein [Rhodospirillaceae bacterium]MBT6137410.1 TRAP transporter substrate-binding protein [Rhodospirillaceae bacterium]
MNVIKTLAFTAIAGAVAFGAISNAQAQKRVKWKMQSAFGSQLSHLGTSGVRFSEKIDKLSGGKFQVKFFEPGALVPALECFDAISKGSIESCWTTPGYHTGKYPGLAFMTAVPFGPQVGEFIGWKWFGGGNALRDEIYQKHNLIAFDCFAIGPETSGWFKTKVVGGVASLKGLKMRFFGLGAKVMTKLGLSTQLLAGADIYPALERGVIDATEFSMPNIDKDLGFYQIAKFNYYPGWHQQVSVSELLMNRDKYNGLPENYRTMLEVTAGWGVMYTYAETEAQNPQAMLDMGTKYGVTNVRWEDADLAAMEKAWNEVMDEESAKDPWFKKFRESYDAFRSKYKIWGDAQSLKLTYLK